MFPVLAGTFSIERIFFFSSAKKGTSLRSHEQLLLLDESYYICYFR